MTLSCLKCGAPVEGRFRPVLGQRRMERLCPACANALSSLVRAAGDTCQLSLADPHFVAWLETGRWPTRGGGSISVEDLPAGLHSINCPCCAALAEDDE